MALLLLTLRGALATNPPFEFLRLLGQDVTMGPKCDPTPSPTPPPPPPPKHCSPGICAGNYHTQYPVTSGVDVNYSSTFAVPAIPSTFNPDNMTYYLYYNLVMDHAEDPIGKYNQFVPQLMLGDAFCNATGPPLYLPTDCLLNPLRTWYIQAQYFFWLKCNAHANAVLGELIPVVEGDTITTSFFLDDSTGGWKLEIAVTSDKDPRPRVSRVSAPTPFLNETLSWTQPPYNSTRLGACWEVYGMGQDTDYPTAMDFKIETSSSVPAPYYSNWSIIEQPTCKFSPQHITVSTKTTDSGKKQEVEFDIHQ